MKEGKKNRSSLNASFVTGAIALVFLIIGYQVALFIHKAALTRIAANKDRPDTVFVIDRALAEEILGSHPDVAESVSASLAGGTETKKIIVRKNAAHASEISAVREKVAPRTVESFRFNPNTASLEDFQRLGFSEKQAQSILNYRAKGGRFRRPADFAKSYVVADSVFERLAPFIDIPKTDINKADSTDLLALPGIGPFFAGKIVSYRKELGGYSRPEQLMEIWKFDREKYDALADLITCSEPDPYPLWSLPESDLAAHPHISKAEAHGIVLYRQHHAPEACTVEGLRQAGVLSQEHADRLALCRIAPAG